MILIEKRIELNSKLYIDSWFDKYSKSYITQVKDEEDNEVDYAYSGNRADRDSDIDYFKNKYKDEIVEYLQPKEDRKKRKQELPMTGLNPILPDQGAGIDTFNKNMDVGGEAAGEMSGGAGE